MHIDSQIRYVILGELENVYFMNIGACMIKLQQTECGVLLRHSVEKTIGLSI